MSLAPPRAPTRTRSVPRAGNLWAQHVFNSLMAQVSGQRPLTLNRLPGASPSNAVFTPLVNPALTSGAALGGHRYPASWTGDIQGDWPTLTAHVRLFPFEAATMLHVYSSADLGGFHGTTAENYVRWLQWGAFTPIFRTHGSSDNEKRIWTFESYPLLADAMRFRAAS